MDLQLQQCKTSEANDSIDIFFCYQRICTALIQQGCGVHEWSFEQETNKNIILRSREILVTYEKYINKMLNLVIIINLSETEYIIIIILKDKTDIAEVLGFKGLNNL